MTLVAFLEKVIQARSTDTVWKTTSEALETHGFDRVIYGFTHFRTGDFVGDSDDLMVLSTYPKAYLRKLLQAARFYRYPPFAWALNNVGAKSWCCVQDRKRKGRLTDAEKDMLKLNQEHGIHAGYTISFMDISARAKGAMALAARSEMSQDDADRIWQVHGKTIEIICNIAHLKLISLPHAPNGRGLTPRQKEVLEWVAQGKTTQDIATILNVTVATVEKHLRLARLVLKVDTTAQAVSKAILRNQLFTS
ncbi:LuxR family transcriptional regulator [Rhodovulum imhoffii]|uniref:LuxR family transcriptional regulator n=1 Tax=Rhodovulum imhoffii TaxID=365340 RepID=A0A2T5BTQ3_9RHOB|nr:LuxR family transcriptional regulator [Rhodovulum imhoffii]PTN02808.1 LuxR family transcriptional regulator [Rhodovulum imhoffii]